MTNIGRSLGTEGHDQTLTLGLWTFDIGAFVPFWFLRDLFNLVHAPCFLLSMHGAPAQTFALHLTTPICMSS